MSVNECLVMLQVEKYNEIFEFHINVSKWRICISQIIPSLFRINGSKCFIKSNKQNELYYRVFLSSCTYIVSWVIGVWLVTGRRVYTTKPYLQVKCDFF